MSWKEKRLITVLSVILAVLFAAVLIVLSVRYRAARAADGNTDQTDPQTTAQTAQSVYTALSYNNGSATLSFALDENGVWYWESEPDFPLNDETIQTILALLNALKPQQTLEMPEDLSEYGLDDPHASLTATTEEGAALNIAMGNSTTDGNSYYATINNDADHIYIIADTLYLAMRKPVYEMCTLPELPTLTEDSMIFVKLQGPDTESEEGIKRGNTTILTAVQSEDGVTTWRSGGANVADTADVQALLEDLTALKVSQCVDFKPSDEAVSFCGFDHPAILTISYKGSSGADALFCMYIGNQNMDGTGRYVRFEEEAAIYLLDLSLLDPMMRLAYQGLEG